MLGTMLMVAVATPASTNNTTTDRLAALRPYATAMRMNASPMTTPANRRTLGIAPHHDIDPVLADRDTIVAFGWLVGLPKRGLIDGRGCRRP